MSLDVYLIRNKWVSYDKGKTHDKGWEDVFDANITHNLTTMAEKAGCYKALWRPEEIGAAKCRNIIKELEAGLSYLKDRPEYFKQFENINGWGTYEQFVQFVENYLQACVKHPNADIFVSR